jgi:O-antigen ligase
VPAPVPNADHQVTTPVPTGPLARLWRVWSLTDADIQAAFDTQAAHRLGRLGIPFHVAFAILWCALAVGPIATVEFGYIPLGVTFLLRLPFIVRTLALTLRTPALIAFAAFVAWSFASLAWAPDMYQAVNDAGALRFAIVVLLIWPVLHARRAMTLALVAGFLAAGVAQALEALGHAYSIDALKWPHPALPEGFPIRLSAWWRQPAVGGAMLVAAVGLSLPTLLGLCAHPTPRPLAWRALAGLALAVALGGILLTGTRGAMLAAIALIALGVLIVVVRALVRARAHSPTPPNSTPNTPPTPRPSPRPRTLLAALATLATLAITAGAWTVAGSAVTTRVSEGIREVRAAARGDYSSDTGARIAMAIWAWDAWRDRPLIGHGAGAFPTIARAALDRHAHADGFKGIRVHTQAHNTLLHVAATLGLVGVLLLAWTILAALRGGLVLASPRPSPPAAPNPDHTPPQPLAHTLITHAHSIAPAYDLGPAFALLGLVLVSAFDTLVVNTQQAALLCTLIALCMPVRPAPPRPPSPAAP